MKLTLTIPDNVSDKALPLISYLQSLDYVTVAQEESNEYELTDEQKKILDQRCKTKREDFIPWSIARKQLKAKRK